MRICEVIDIRSPIYWSGWIYRASTHALHGKGLKRRYDYIRSLILPNENVLDVGCGTGTLQSHLEGNNYLGIELNANFVRYAKSRGRNVVLQDALTFTRYGDFDVCVIIDFLHHIAPQHGKFLAGILQQVRKRVIVCEPFEVKGRHPLVSKFMDIIDDDGINDPDKWMGKDELIRFYSCFKPKQINEVGQAIIAKFECKKNTR
jgi:SAM-dependent methyltransferase